MKRWFGFAAALVVVALAASVASAQEQQQQRQRGQGRGQGGGFGGGMGGMGADPIFLLGQESVQKELTLTEDQIKKVKDLQEKRRSAFGAGGGGGAGGFDREAMQKRMEEQRKENDKFVADTLKPEQAKRLNQIVLQRRGAGALNDPKVQDEIKLTDEQREKIKAINEDMAKSRRELFQPGQPPSEEARTKMQELTKATNDKLVAVLTADQKTKWTDMTGPKFEGKIETPQFGRPRQNQ